MAITKNMMDKILEMNLEDETDQDSKDLFLKKDGQIFKYKIKIGFLQ